MEPPFVPETTKTPEQVRAEYRAADSETDWVLGEIADFFTDGARDLSDEERRAVAEQILTADGASFDRFLAGEYPEHAVVAVELRVSNYTQKTITVSAFATVPTPTSLLWLCTEHVALGEEVTLVQHMAGGTQYEISAYWPFGMHEAVLMTTPNPEGLAMEVPAERSDDAPTPVRRGPYDVEADGGVPAAVVAGRVAVPTMPPSNRSVALVAALGRVPGLHGL